MTVVGVIARAAGYGPIELITVAQQLERCNDCQARRLSTHPRYSDEAFYTLEDKSHRYHIYSAERTPSLYTICTQLYYFLFKKKKKKTYPAEKWQYCDLQVGGKRVSRAETASNELLYIRVWGERCGRRPRVVRVIPMTACCIIIDVYSSIPQKRMYLNKYRQMCLK